MTGVHHMILLVSDVDSANSAHVCTSMLYNYECKKFSEKWAFKVLNRDVGRVIDLDPC